MVGNPLVNRLISKHERSIERHLEDAIEANRINEQYNPPPQRGNAESIEEFAQRLALYAADYQFVNVFFNRESHYVAFGVPGPLETSHGKFTLVPAQVVGGRWGIHYFLFHSSLENLLKRKSSFIRLDSGCTSGQIFGDITCDCDQQLDLAMRRCIQEGAGIIVNMPQHDGRGWGEYKMANQQLMIDHDLDTVTAAKLFYGSIENIDQRTYSEAVIILRAFGFGTEHVFRVGTNNPRKAGAFTTFGMSLESIEPIISEETNQIVNRNLRAKAKYLRHSIPDSNG